MAFCMSCWRSAISANASGAEEETSATRGNSAAVRRRVPSADPGPPPH
jgi:hypothetical protein